VLAAGLCLETNCSHLEVERREFAMFGFGVYKEREQGACVSKCQQPCKFVLPV
jgi:hypothetical protein